MAYFLRQQALNIETEEDINILSGYFLSSQNDDQKVSTGTGPQQVSQNLDNVLIVFLLFCINFMWFISIDN